MKARLIFAVLVLLYGVRASVRPPLGPYTTPWRRFRLAVWKRVQAAYDDTGLPLLWWRLQQDEAAAEAKARRAMRVTQQREGGAK